MKRLFLLALVILVCASGLREARAQNYASGFIPNVTATASSFTSSNSRFASKATDNSGMTETETGSKTGTHSNSTSAVWLNDGSAGSLANTWIEFDLGSTRNLDEMWIWNLNQASYNSKRELKTVYIKYKVNSIDAWITLGGAAKTYTFAEATGASGLAATNQAGGAGPVLFGSVPARYVRIESAGGTGVGNYYTSGSEQYAGLSEVRFYETVTAPAVYINPSSINFRLIKTGQKGQAKLVLGAGSGPATLTFNSAAFAPGSKVAFVAPAPTFPMTFSAGQRTTLTLEYSPTAVELHQTTLTLNVTAGATTNVNIPLTGAGVEWAPGFIPNPSVTASSEYTGRTALNTVNNSGMLSDTLSMAGLKTVMHNTDVNSMWMSASTTNIPGEWIQYDLGQAYPLDEMWLWNFNQGGYGPRGLKECKIFYKLNLADAWTQLGGATQTYVMKQAPAATTGATNQDISSLPIAFGGTQVRYVRLEVVSNWTDANYVGLSEVRFYSVATQPYVNPAMINFGQVETGKSGTAKLTLGALGGSSNVTFTSATFAAGSKVTFTPALTLPVSFAPGTQTTYTLAFSPTAVGLHQTNLNLGMTIGGVPSSMQVSISGTGIQYAPGFIPVVSATSSSFLPADNRAAVNTINHSGMSGETLSNIGSKGALHGTSNATFWLSAGTLNIAAEWIEYDFGKSYNLNEMWIWNINQGGFGDRCIKDCKILYKVNAGDAWTQLQLTNLFTLKQAPLVTTAATNQDTTTEPIHFGNVPVRYVRLEPVTNYGSTQYVGLAEVRFYTYVAPPNPVTHWLLFE